MNQEKTEPPTKRKLKKARMKGEIAKSSFFAGALIFMGAILCIWGSATLLGSRFITSMQNGLRNFEMEGAFAKVMGPLIYPVILIMVGIFLLSIIAHLLQTGWVWSIETLYPRWHKPKREYRFVMPILYMILMIGGTYFAIKRGLNLEIFFISVKEQGKFFFKNIMRFSSIVGIFSILLGLCDFFYQKSRYYKRMYMTPQEKNEELREAEGNPHLKGLLRKRH
ncbi:MAG: EscU/YscU/HrcU family type III secretion system export apparatus switch protein [Chlamydiales bacterium]